ncbi:hypothetical protein PM082_008324 [Marasmius tenuissimus]|nr:hypothetical protein PM082_008324 [Marasmius tenuissimus]
MTAATGYAAVDQYRDAIQDLINGGNVEAAVSKLTQPTLDAISRTTHGGSDGGDDKVEDTLWGLWSAFVRAARETPEEKVHDRLITGLQTIKSLPPALVQKNGDKEQYSIWDLRVWDDLPVFGAELREEWNYTDEDDETKRTQWANLNAFVSRIVVAQLSDFELYAIWTLRDALESPELDEGDASLNGHVPAAAQWIFIAGSLIYENDREWSPPPNQGNPARGGPLAPDVKKGFSKERWALWKKGFQAVSKNSGSQVAEGTKGTATKALQKMEEIENKSQR